MSELEHHEGHAAPEPGAEDPAPGAGAAEPAVGGAVRRRRRRKERTVFDPGVAAAMSGVAAGGSGVDPTEDAAEGASLELRPGLAVQQYELIRELGRGGMGQVFLARDNRLGRKVAIKFLHRASPAVTDRFLVEARATAQLNHEHIVTIYEVNEHLGLPFMVLEYLEGRPLSALLEGQPFPPARAVELMLPVVRALETAHAAGIVHRDLKPENLYVSASGVIKVLDFGIAKLRSEVERTEQTPVSATWSSFLQEQHGAHLTRAGAVLGTLSRMAPEQWGLAPVDHRADLWAVGLLLYELLAGAHPLAGLTSTQLMGEASRLEVPLPGVGSAVRGLPADLERVVDRCLAKRPEQRFASAAELREQLELAVPVPLGQRLGAEECPYPGLTAFQERDATRFFGREADVGRLVGQLDSAPLAVVVGPSGVGKSSFVRAGLVPALKASGEAWETFITRPGRAPLAGLADLAATLGERPGAETAESGRAASEGGERLREQPGLLGSRLRARARATGRRMLLFVDQFEELYTQGIPGEETATFLAVLLGLADDASSPVRLVLSMRSDFLDRAAEDQAFGAALARSLFFLHPPSREGLAEAVTKPAAMAGHQFEDPRMVAEMLDELEDTPGALPLLQFAAATLWDSRDRDRKLLPRAGYDAMGGVAGALASHADEMLSRFAAAELRVVRAVFGRLVSSERTRVIVEVADLAELGAAPGQVEPIVRRLVEARLLAVHQRGADEGTAVEIVHESLVHRWPTLRRWLDESQEDSAFLEQLRGAAKQWAARARAQGLLWRGEAVLEARRFAGRYKGPLAGHERAYLEAVIALADRSIRRRRVLVVGAFAVLVALLLVGVVTILRIRSAEQAASHQATVAQAEAARARRAEKEVTRQLDLVRQKDQLVVRGKQALQKTETELQQSATQLKRSETSLNLTYQQLKDALRESRAAQAKAEEASRLARQAAVKAKESAKAEREAKQKAERLLAQERERLRRLLAKRKTIATDLQ